jgi:hypothetical protein
MVFQFFNIVDANLKLPTYQKVSNKKIQLKIIVKGVAIRFIQLVINVVVIISLGDTL